MCYSKENSQLKFADAFRECQKYLGSLAEVQDEKVQNFIKDQFVDLAVYIGLNDIFIEGDFRWIGSEEKLGWYANWGPGQPADEFYFKDEDCVQILGSGDWNDVTCDFVFSSVCETNRITQGQRKTKH